MPAETDVEDAFLQAIHRDPDDDAARLVYADWLEERGDLRAEYLRLEMQLRRIPARLLELSVSIDARWLAAVTPRWRVMLAPGAHENPIGAIKVIREVTGLGLKEAKDIYDRARAGEPSPVVQHLDRAVAEQIVAKLHGLARAYLEPHSAPLGAAPRFGRNARFNVVLVRVAAERRLDAIKLAREWLGLGLRDARELIDAVEHGTERVVVEGADAARARACFEAFSGIIEVRVTSVA